MSWHLADDDLRRYRADDLVPPLLWSVEAHVLACGDCRDRLAALVDVGAGWSRLDAAMDAPRPGRVETALMRLGVSDPTARILVVTPWLRASWLSSAAITVALVALASQLATALDAPLPLLAVVPLMPLAGVATSFRFGLDPTHETAVVAPLSTLRLMLLRTVTVLAVTTLLAGAASLALPRFGLAAFGWLLPAWALTLVSLYLVPRFGAIIATTGVSLGWSIAVIGTSHPATGASVLFGPGGQWSLALLGGVAVLAIAINRSRFDAIRRTRRRAS